MARRLGRSPQRAVAAVGLCPVVLGVGVAGFHNDAPAVLCIVAAAACLLLATDGASAAAGALAVAAAGLKPSFAIVVPLVVLGAPRRVPALAGAAWAAAGVTLLIVGLFGGALPAVGLQSRLVSPVSVPNLLGLAAGHGGADAAVRATAQHALLVAVAIACALVAWRRRWALSAMGIVMFAGVLALAWVMPWYLGWALPFAALARPRALAGVAVVAALWLGLGGMSQVTRVVHAFDYYPTQTPTGLANHDLSMWLVR
jgi:alpha-1,6-mannosyltransferase